MGVRRAWSSPTFISGRARNGFAACASWSGTSLDSGSRSGTTTTVTPGKNSGIPATSDETSARVADRDGQGASDRDTRGEDAHALSPGLDGASPRAALRRSPDGGGWLLGAAELLGRVGARAHRRDRPDGRTDRRR